MILFIFQAWIEWLSNSPVFRACLFLLMSIEIFEECPMIFRKKISICSEFHYLEKERERDRERERERESEREGECVCVCEREREREKQRSVNVIQRHISHITQKWGATTIFFLFLYFSETAHWGLFLFPGVQDLSKDLSVCQQHFLFLCYYCGHNIITGISWLFPHMKK